MERVIESVTLAYSDQTANKLYRIDLIEVTEGGQLRGYKVTGYNKRRENSNFVEQPKITTPTSLSNARAAFNELERKKCSRSYKTKSTMSKECSVCPHIPMVRYVLAAITNYFLQRPLPA